MRKYDAADCMIWKTISEDPLHISVAHRLQNDSKMKMYRFENSQRALENAQAWKAKFNLRLCNRHHHHELKLRRHAIPRRIVENIGNAHQIDRDPFGQIKVRECECDQNEQAEHGHNGLHVDRCVHFEHVQIEGNDNGALERDEEQNHFHHGGQGVGHSAGRRNLLNSKKLLVYDWKNMRMKDFRTNGRKIGQKNTTR